MPMGRGCNKADGIRSERTGAAEAGAEAKAKEGGNPDGRRGICVRSRNTKVTIIKRDFVFAGMALCWAAMPFGVGTCKGVTVSAWREGKFYGDAMSVAFAKSVAKRKDTPLPAQCARANFATLGRPMMREPFSSGLQSGLSVADEKIELEKPAVLHLWIDNPSDTEVAVSTCMDLDYFWAAGFDLYDAAGHRVLRKKMWEPERKPSAGAEEKPNQLCEGSWFCARNFAIRIPAHTCFNGEADPKGYDFNRDLAMYYDLPLGTYYVVPRTGKMDANRCQDVAPKLEPEALRDRLRLTIVEN